MCRDVTDSANTAVRTQHTRCTESLIAPHKTLYLISEECTVSGRSDRVKDLAGMMEFEVSDTRPTPEFWETFDRQGYLKECLDRHSEND